MITSRWLGKLHGATHIREAHGNVSRAARITAREAVDVCIQGRGECADSYNVPVCFVVPPFRPGSIRSNGAGAYAISSSLNCSLSPMLHAGFLQPIEVSRRQETTGKHSPQRQRKRRCAAWGRRRKEKEETKAAADRRETKATNESARGMYCESNVIMIKAPNNKTTGGEECEGVLARSSTSLNQSRRRLFGSGSST